MSRYTETFYASVYLLTMLFSIVIYLVSVENIVDTDKFT